MRRLVFSLVMCVVCFTSCGLDDADNTFSTKYRVAFYFEVNRSAELYNTMGNIGVYATIRQVNGLIQVSSSAGTNDYDPTRIGTDFRYGLGGLIVGNTALNGPVAYDLACPNCDRSYYRLKVENTGRAICEHCGTSYDMNNNGWILAVNDSAADGLRGLYRYRIDYNGAVLHVYN